MTTNHLDLIIFCAEWCTACREFRALLESDHAITVPHFYWVDIENTALMPDELDIENLPSIAIIKHNRTLFFGAVEPRVSHLKKLLAHPIHHPIAESHNALILSLYDHLKTK